MNILFTCAGRRNYLIEYFQKALNGGGKVIAADMQISAPAMVVADKSYKVSEVYAEHYIDEILDICKKENIGAVFSLNDLELPILSNARTRFMNHGINLMVSSSEVIDICFDKYKTHEFLLEIGLKSPLTFISGDEAQNAINEKKLPFPFVLKPRWGSASIGIYFPKNMEQLSIMEKLAKLQIKDSILLRASNNDIDRALLYQEMINGTEFGLDIINDLEGNYITTIAKQKLGMRAGETDKAVIIDDNNLQTIGEKIGCFLKHIGNLDCDVFYNGKDYYVLEMNPRFGGGFPFSYEAGVNLPAVLLKWLNKESVDLNLLKPKKNIAFAKCDKLIKIAY
ncbi:MAG: ATP-grasp domain-containing protein [Thiohalospira sp.]